MDRGEGGVGGEEDGGDIGVEKEGGGSGTRGCREGGGGLLPPIPLQTTRHPSHTPLLPARPSSTLRQQSLSGEHKGGRERTIGPFCTRERRGEDRRGNYKA